MRHRRRNTGVRVEDISPVIQVTRCMETYVTTATVMGNLNVSVAMVMVVLAHLETATSVTVKADTRFLRCGLIDLCLIVRSPVEYQV